MKAPRHRPRLRSDRLGKLQASDCEPAPVGRSSWTEPVPESAPYLVCGDLLRELRVDREQAHRIIEAATPEQRDRARIISRERLAAFLDEHPEALEGGRS